MNKIIVVALAVAVAGQALFVGAPSAQALSCLPVDMYLDSVVNEEKDGRTVVFVGTATTDVTADHMQKVIVTKALKGEVASKVTLNHPYSNDWQYYCSHGPSKAGESTVFLAAAHEVLLNSFTVYQTLDADSAEAKAFISDLEKKNFDASITDTAEEPPKTGTPTTTPDENEETLRGLFKTLISVLTEMLEKLKAQQSAA